MKKGGNWRRRFTRFIGGSLVFISIFAVLVSVGVPGLGWVISAISLVGASLLMPLIGRRYVGVSLGICIIHLFTFGPLSNFKSLNYMSIWFSIILVAAPLAIASTSILVSVWRQRRRPT